MRRYPEKVHQYIAQNVEGRTTKELVELVNAEFGSIFTESKIKAYKKNHKLKSGTPGGVPAGKATNLYPEAIQKFIKENLAGVGPKEMAELLNENFGTSYTISQMKAYYGNRHLDSGVKGHFPKGNVPANKGKKGQYPAGCEKSWFMPGHTPVNHKPVGSERIDNKDGYTLVKIAEPNVWSLKHKVIWEEKYGKIPEGHVLTFLDENKSNITLENLGLITMAESLALTRGQLRSSNPDFTKTGILIVKVESAGRKRRKGVSV